MCLAVPGKIIEIQDNTAIVDYDGIKREVSLALIEAKVGDYIVANAGFAIQKINQKEAEESIKLFKELS